MQQLLRPVRPNIYANTTVSQQVAGAVDFAIETKSAVVIRGPAGMGKSSAIAALAEQRPYIKTFEIIQNSRSNQVLMDSVGACFDEYQLPLRHFAVLCDRIAGRVALSSHRHCLIVDEVQRAGSDGIRMLLSFHEHCNLPMVLVGNNAALRRTSANAAAFDQISDRIAHWLPLDQPIAEDVEAVAKAWGVTGDRELKLIVDYGTSRTLRQVAHLLRACAAGTGDGQPITADILKQVLRLMGQSPRLPAPTLWASQPTSADETAA